MLTSCFCGRNFATLQCHDWKNGTNGGHWLSGGDLKLFPLLTGCLCGLLIRHGLFYGAYWHHGCSKGVLTEVFATVTPTVLILEKNGKNTMKFSHEWFRRLARHLKKSKFQFHSKNFSLKRTSSYYKKIYYLARH